MYVSLFRSRTVEDAVIQRFGLMARYRKKTMSDARTAFENHSTVALGVKDGLIRITVEDRDPKMAADIANGYVDEFRKLSANLAITEASQRRLFFQQQLLEARGNLTDGRRGDEEHPAIHGRSSNRQPGKGPDRTLPRSCAAQVVAKEVQIQAMRSFATEDNPDLIIAKRQLAALQAQLEKIAGAGRTRIRRSSCPRARSPRPGWSTCASCAI